MSLRFVVILRFEGERSTMLNLSLPCYGTSWADYSEETERQREESLNVVVEKPRRAAVICVGCCEEQPRSSRRWRKLNHCRLQWPTFFLTGHATTVFSSGGGREW